MRDRGTLLLLLLLLLSLPVHRVFVLETGEKSEIGALVASYCPSLANWIREAEAPLRKVLTSTISTSP